MMTTITAAIIQNIGLYGLPPPEMLSTAASILCTFVMAGPVTLWKMPVPALPCPGQPRAAAMLRRRLSARSLNARRASSSWVSLRSLRKWIRQAEVDGGTRPGVTSEESAEIRRLKREVAELRRANEILKAASVFFAAELDRPHPRS